MTNVKIHNQILVRIVLRGIESKEGSGKMGDRYINCIRTVRIHGKRNHIEFHMLT